MTDTISDLRAARAKLAQAKESALADLERREKHRAADGRLDNPRFADGAMASYIQHERAKSDLAKIDDRIRILSPKGPGNEYMAAANDALMAMVNGGEIDSAFASASTGAHGRRGVRLDTARMAAVVSDGNAVDGSAAVGEGAFETLADAVKYSGALGSMARHIVTPTGEPMDFLRMDDSGTDGAWLAQNAADTEGNTSTVRKLTTSPQRVTSKRMNVSREMIRDSVFSVVDYLTTAGGARVSRSISKEMTKDGTGTGTPERPYALKDAAKVGVTTASATAVTREEVQKLIGEIDFGYIAGAPALQPTSSAPTLDGRGMVGFQFGEDLWKSLLAEDLDHRNLSFGAGAGSLPTWRGFPFAVNDNLASVAADSVVGLFGDFSSVLIRTVGEIEVLPWPDYDRNQISFRVYAYVDGGVWRGLDTNDRVTAGLAKSVVSLKTKTA